jgi:hypothetical protein
MIAPMILTYHGKDFIKAQSGDTIMAVNPISKSSKLKTTKFGADVALISTIDADHNGIEEVTFGTKVPFVAVGPGEYETKDIFIKGFLSEGEDKKINTIYTALFDGINLCFLGALASSDLPEEAVESLIDIDILFVPVSDALPADKAYKLAVSLEPKLIIPLGDEADVKKFVKEAGGSSPEKTEKLTLKKKDLDGKEGDIVILSA